LTEADTLTIRLGATPSGLTSADLTNPMGGGLVEVEVGLLRILKYVVTDFSLLSYKVYYKAF